MLVALLGALGRPSDWTLSLAGFLVRGGIVVLVAPIVVAPSTIGLANSIAPTLTPFLFGQPSPAFATLMGSLVAALTTWVIVGGLIGAWIDLALVRTAAVDEDLGLWARLGARSGAVWRALAVRLLGYIPLAVALAWSATRIVDAAYQEVILPAELATPIVLRVLLDVPDAIAVVVAAWLFGDTVASLAQRRLWSSSVSIPGALGWALARIVGRPLTTLATIALTSVVVVAAALPTALVAGIAWERLRIALQSDAGVVEVTVALAVFVALWLGALVLSAAATAWRSYAWTAEAYRSDGRAEALEGKDRPPETVRDARTIGEADVGRPGEWPSPGTSGSL